jgi:hypothetical protein
MPPCSFRSWLVLLLALFVVGCAGAKKKKEPTENDAREAFSNLQEAIGELREGDTNKLWDLLCKDTREDADNFAKKFSAQIAKKSPEDVAEVAEQFGVPAEELKKKITGKRYVQLIRAKLYKKYFLLLSAPMDHFTYDEGDLKVYYKGEDEKNETKSVIFVRENKQWKAVVDLR